MTEPLRWGIVSAGKIANTFARDTALVPNARIAAVAARRLAAAREFAGRHGIATAYEGYDALFADPDIDAVYVATPHALHFSNASAALEAGKHVLCEKPITVSEAELRTLIEVARHSDRYLMEAMWTWFLPAVQTAKEWVDDGRIGALRHIKADFGYPAPFDPASRLYDPAMAGGCLLDVGVYPIALARYFGGQAPAEIDVVVRYAPNGVDDDVVVLFDYDNYVATLAASFRCKLQNTAYIIGSEGYIAIPHCWRARECELFVMDERVDSFVDDRTGSGFEFQIESASRDILEGKRESGTVPHAMSLAFQQDMDRVKAQFGRR